MRVDRHFQAPERADLRSQIRLQHRLDIADARRWVQITPKVSRHANYLATLSASVSTVFLNFGSCRISVSTLVTAWSTVV